MLKKTKYDLLDEVRTEYNNRLDELKKDDCQNNYGNRIEISGYLDGRETTLVYSSQNKSEFFFFDADETMSHYIIELIDDTHLDITHSIIYSFIDSEIEIKSRVFHFSSEGLENSLLPNILFFAGALVKPSLDKTIEDIANFTIFKSITLEEGKLSTICSDKILPAFRLNEAKLVNQKNNSRSRKKVGNLL